MTDYEFLPNIPIDEGHTLHQLTGRFQTVKDGLPELPKNSKDQYFRLGYTDRATRQIVIIVNSSVRSLAVLDFAGAAAEDFTGWQTWSSRTANQAERSGDIEGGHGNGGKAFMVRGSAAESFMESCFRGRRTKMGFKNDDPNHLYYPAYAREHGRRICNLVDTSVDDRLRAGLALLDVDYEQLPPRARAAFEVTRAFTLVHIAGIRDWAGRRASTIKTAARQMVEDLIEHAQVALTLETCDVWVMVDGECITETALGPKYPDPLPGFENLPPIPLPDQLIDPETRQSVSTGSGTPKELLLRTSREPLRRSDRRKAMNVVRVRNQRNIVDNWSVPDLAPRPESQFIYGVVHVPGFTAEHEAGAARMGMAETPLVRAVREWVSDQVNDLAHRIQQSQARNHRPEDRERASDALERFRELMRRFLRPDIGDGPQREYGNNVNEIILEGGRQSIALAVGTSIPLQINCYEATQNKRLPVLNVPLEMVSEENDLLAFGDDGRLTAVKAGKTRIRMRVVGTEVESEPLTVELVKCGGVNVIAPDRALKKGEHVRLTTIFLTDGGQRDDLLIEGRTRQDLLVDGMVDEADMGKLGRTGWFTAGQIEGIATVRVKFGPNVQDTSTATLTIGPEVAAPRRQPPGRDNNRGDIPLILLCGTTAPDMEDLPPDQRTHTGGNFHPTIIEEPPFDHVVWINPLSKEANRVRQERGGPAGIDRIASKAFLQFIALKCFDILKRLKVRQEVQDISMTEVEFRDRLSQAEMDCADFIDAAFDIADSLLEDH